jgi:chromosome segregation ATPase
VTESRRRSGVDLRVAIILAIVLLLGLGGAAAWAVTSNNELQSAKATIQSTSDELKTTTSNRDGTKKKLDTATADVAAARQAIKDDKAKITVLKFQIDRKAACIKAQSTNLAEIRRILALERENLARTMTGSAWAKAFAAEQKAINAAIDYLYRAYTSAAAGKLSTANSYISKSNAQIRVSNGQVKNINKAIDEINASTKAINNANDAFETTLDQTSSTCGS